MPISIEHEALVDDIIVWVNNKFGNEKFRLFVDRVDYLARIIHQSA